MIIMTTNIITIIFIIITTITIITTIITIINIIITTITIITTIITTINITINIIIVMFAPRAAEAQVANHAYNSYLLFNYICTIFIGLFYF